MQCETATSDDIWQLAIFFQEFVVVQIIVSYHKVDIQIWQLGLNIWRILAQELHTPQIYSYGLLLLLFITTAGTSQQGNED